MTVQELIENLQEQRPDAVVIIRLGNYDDEEFEIVDVVGKPSKPFIFITVE